jgi:predicted O-linked N-acetylglucosamine transferase (SPINDLY family)
VPRRADGGQLRIGYPPAIFAATPPPFSSRNCSSDRLRFEITACSDGPEDRSEIGARLRKAFDHFVDLNSLSDDEAARRI